MQTRVGRIYRLWIDITILTNSCTQRQYQRPSYRLEKTPSASNQSQPHHLSIPRMRHNLNPSTPVPNRQQCTTPSTTMSHILKPRRQIRDAAKASHQAQQKRHSTTLHQQSPPSSPPTSNLLRSPSRLVFRPCKLFRSTHWTIHHPRPIL